MTAPVLAVESRSRVTLVYGNPLTAPAPATIELKESQRPPAVPVETRPSFFDMLKGIFKK